jgi:hypothetical protein
LGTENFLIFNFMVPTPQKLFGRNFLMGPKNSLTHEL